MKLRIQKGGVNEVKLQKINVRQRFAGRWFVESLRPYLKGNKDV